VQHRTLSLVALAAAALTVSGCASGVEASPDPQETAFQGHGHVEGAAEMSEPQLALTTVDAQGRVQQLDLLDQTRSDIASVDEPTALSTDGRYLFTHDADGITIVDSGRWTWDHVDHFHYYLAEPREIGSVEGAGPAAVATTNSSTTGGTGVFFAGSGDAVLLDTAALSQGEISELFRVTTEPHDGLVVPVGSFALVTEAEGGSAASLVGYDADGEELAGMTIDCPDARGTITTRVGAVVGCSDGAVLAALDGDELTLEKIPYPEATTAPAATTFANREGRPTVAAVAGDEGIWILHTRERAWTLLPAPTPLLQVSAVDDADEHLVALAADGRVLVLDGATGAEVASTEPLLVETLADADALAGVSLIADQQRVYLNAPLEQTMYEIDFADGARIARTFDTDTVPALMAETGR